MIKNSQDHVKDFLHRSMNQVYANVRALIDDAILLYCKNRFPRASFCAITAIEETGKLWVLAFEYIKVRTNKDYKPDMKKLQKIVTDHTGKALEMAAHSLFINSGADRRHGKHPNSGILRSSGIVLLARSGQWMKWRNNCCYVDIDFEKEEYSVCQNVIDKATAYYFICMAYEGIAEVPDTEFWLKILEELKEFMKQFGKEVNLDKLDFLANPEKYKALAKKRNIPFVWKKSTTFKKLFQNKHRSSKP